MSKENNLKEQFKQAILSTAKVISDDYKIKIDKKNNSFLDLFTSNLEQATKSWFDELPAYRWRME